MSEKYSSSPEWADIEPIPLDEGRSNTEDGRDDEDGPLPLATIAYSSEYLEATSYLRAVMAANEMSERALRLTEDVISMNPAHYTVWLYRAKVLLALKKDLYEELMWLNKVSVKYLKNYQIWHHRHVIVANKEQFPALPTNEQDFLKQMFDLDSKNYHVWAYRQWLVRHFDLWDSEREIRDVEDLLNSDVRNNSAWNHRYFLRFAPRTGFSAGLAGTNVLGEPRGRLEVVDEDIIDAELDFTKRKIVLAPENRSPWLYARGVLRAAGRPLAEWKDFAGRFVTEELDDNDNVLDIHVKSSLAVEWLADVYGEEAEASGDDAKENAAEAVKMFTLLKDKYDPIRKNYWDYRIRSVGKGATSAISV